ncbi:hypothetical protein [Paenibacillus montanisoli]|uniref:DUF5666 domain-containing protein n=1 Tax=Paenibacillus montanisoli TaxID=2081970 RepID=A0A328U115_9BACL|nr:hypothetical protein [Paenibacillus montanisoli]RAP75131.1 hypothetical protein DL346_17255 [Paenibacillus montanisoli]
MDRNSLKLMAAAMLLAAMLTGCGSQNGDQQAANNGQAAASAGFNAGGSNQPDRTADFFAKVVKADGDSITVQKSTMSPADMPQGGFGGRGGQRPNRDAGAGGNNAAPPEGELPPMPDDGGELPPPPDDAGEMPAPPDDAGASGNAGGAPNGDRQGGGRFGGGGFMNQMKFEDAQSTIGVDAETEIVSMGRGQDGMTENTLKASDLKEGDIVTVWLSSDNKTAQYISLRFMPGMPGKEGNGQ